VTQIILWERSSPTTIEARLSGSQEPVATLTMTDPPSWFRTPRWTVKNRWGRHWTCKT
jgi:hypothetical protein